MSDKKAKELLRRALPSVENDFLLFVSLKDQHVMPAGSDEEREVIRVVNETRQLMDEINEFIRQ